MRMELHDFQRRDLCGGRLALNLVNTVTARDSTPRDWLADYGGLLAWAALTGTVDARTLAGLRRLAARDAGAAAAALQRCKALRETLHALLSGLIAGKPPSESGLGSLDTMRKAASGRARLVSTEEGIAAVPSFALAGLDLIADLVLRDALDFMAQPPRDRLRVCAGHDCGWLFLDTSKAGRRRWCDMGTCGLAEKQRRHRSSLMPALLGWMLAAAFSMPSGEALASPPVRWTPPALSSKAYESSPAFSPDGRELVFMRADPGFSTYTLLRSRCGGRGWSAPEPLPLALPGQADDGDPFITRDGRRLYFISTRPAPGKTGKDFDIWYAERQGQEWGRPVRLPAPVNSPHAELMPRVLDDGRLYFGSDRPGGAGGNDVYVATPLPGGRWRVENLGLEINSPANEFEVEVSSDERTLILVSDRAKRSHLYQFGKSADGRWQALGQVPARDDVFQVGPLLSPKGDRVLFAQADAVDSGELYLADLGADVDRSWPPGCASSQAR